MEFENDITGFDDIGVIIAVDDAHKLEVDRWETVIFWASVMASMTVGREAFEARLSTVSSKLNLSVLAVIGVVARIKVVGPWKVAKRAHCRAL